MAAERRSVNRDSRGETLIESLIAILILSLVAVASYAGLETGIKVSVMHREQAVAETLLRSAAERLQDPSAPYVPRAGCPGADNYAGLPSSAGYSPVVATARFWIPPAGVANDVTTQFESTAVCPAVDPGLQLIVLTVITPAGHLESLEIVKRAS